MKNFSGSTDLSVIDPALEESDENLFNKIAKLDLPEACDPMTLVYLIEENEEANTIDANDIRAVHEPEDASKIISILKASQVISVKENELDEGVNEHKLSLGMSSRVLTREEELKLFKTLESETKNALLAIFNIPIYFDIIKDYIFTSVSNRGDLKAIFDFDRLDSDKSLSEEETEEEKERPREAAQLDLVQGELSKWKERIETEFCSTDNAAMQNSLKSDLSVFLTEGIHLRKKSLDTIFHMSSDFSEEIIQCQKELTEISDHILDRTSFLKVFVENESSNVWIKALLEKAKGSHFEIGILESRLEIIRRKYEAIEDRVNMSIFSFKEKNKKVGSASRKIEKQYSILYNHNRRLVSSILSKRIGVFDESKSKDLIQEGAIGLIHAIEKFNYRKGHKFSTYAVRWIKVSIDNAIKTQKDDIYTPSHIISKLRTMRIVESEFVKANGGRKPTEEELAKKLGTNIKNIRSLKENESKVFLSLNKSPTSDDGSGRNFEELLPDLSSESPEDTVSSKQIQESVQKLLEKLSPLEEEVVCYAMGIYFGERMTLSEIGKKYMLGPERVRIILKDAKKKLFRYAQRINLEKGLRNEFDIKKSGRL